MKSINYVKNENKKKICYRTSLYPCLQADLAMAVAAVALVVAAVEVAAVEVGAVVDIES